jgi:hypothetical protein
MANCPTGKSGPFCKPCPIGTFKMFFGKGSCEPCKNKPDNSNYVQSRLNSPFCTYECIKGLRKME